LGALRIDNSRRVFIVSAIAMNTDSSGARPIRWRIAVGILILACVALVVIWTRELSRQERILKTGGLIIITTFLLLLWALLLSRFRGKTKLFIFLGVVAVIVGAASSLRITGVTGDLMPIVGFRWQKASAPKTQQSADKVSKRNEAADFSFPQFLGPTRNGVITGVRLETNWTAHAPQELWRHAVGPAWTGFAIENGAAITQEQRGDEELVTCYDLLTGGLLWTHADATRYATTIAGEGPRANPTIVSNRVYTLGANGLLNCLDRATGAAIWALDLVKEHHAKVPDWGFPGAPLVHDGAVIVAIGAKPDRSLVAQSAADGKFLWGSGDDAETYSSPTILNLVSTPQIVLFNHKQVEGRDAKTGAMLWTHDWPTSHPHIAMPIQISTNQLLFSSGYGDGSALLEIASTNSSWKAERVWKSNRLKSKFANLILYGGFVYGLDDGILACIDPKTGDRKWHGSRLGHGQLLLVENVILMTAENGEILLVDPSPDEERIVARFRAFKDKTWNPPALAGPYLLVRNNAEAACYRLPLAAK
jgi:outer membrane protein assembly factor BamB